MAENATVARPYARAAFMFAREHHALANWSRLLGSAAAVAADPAARGLFSHPRVDRERLVELIAGVAAGAGATIDAEARNFLRALAENHRLGLLAEIAVQFEALRADVENTLDVEVATALPLEAAQRDVLAGALEKRFGRKVRIAEHVDAALIGGAVIRAGDLIIDGSLVSRLQRLEQQISQS